jgi:tight adherence protein C
MMDLIATTPSIRVAVLLGVFALVVVLALVGLSFAGRRSMMRGQLRDISSGGASLEANESLSRRRDSAWERLVDRIEKAGLDLADTKGEALREKLVAAGYESPSAPQLFTLLRLGLVIVLPTAYVLLTLLAGQEISIFRLYLIGSAAALAGLFLPSLIIQAKADRRREAIVNGFPDCLDLMLVCVEAGLGLEAALDRVGREMVMAHPLVARLLTTATLRLRAGASREEALRQMAEEAGVDEIRSFATLLIQSDKLGTSVATTLRVYAAEMRERRRMRAEERAHRLPVLISIPLVACMLPTMIGTLMLPAAIRVVRIIFPAMTGQGG